MKNKGVWHIISKKDFQKKKTKSLFGQIIFKNNFIF